jgi:hypothetical protein
MTKQVFPIKFGKVRYAPGAPKTAPRWIWACDCDKCRQSGARVHGPFKTSREAERDAEAAVMLLAAEDSGARH